MLDHVLPYALILLIVGGCGVIKLGGWFWRSGPHSSLLLWCARMKCFSVVDTEVTQSCTHKDGVNIELEPRHEISL